MKYRTHDYAEALAGAIIRAKGGGETAIAKNFLALLRKNGDEGRLRRILEIAERKIFARSGKRRITVISARALKESPAALLKEMLRPGDAAEAKVDSSLVAGLKLVVNGELQFDGSLRGKLDKIFGTFLS